MLFHDEAAQPSLSPLSAATYTASDRAQYHERRMFVGRIGSNENYFSGKH
jgi:hypothetical protein